VPESPRRILGVLANRPSGKGASRRFFPTWYLVPTANQRTRPL